MVFKKLTYEHDKQSYNTSITLNVF